MYYDLYYERKREAGCTFSSNVLVDEKKKFHLSKYISFLCVRERERERERHTHTHTHREKGKKVF